MLMSIRSHFQQCFDLLRTVQGRGIGRLSYYVIKSIQRPLNYRHCNSAVKYHHFHSSVNSILDQSLLKNVCSHPLNDQTTTNWLISSQKNLLHSKISYHGLVKLYTTQSPSQRARKKVWFSESSSCHTSLSLITQVIVSSKVFPGIQYSQRNLDYLWLL